METDPREFSFDAELDRADWPKRVWDIIPHSGRTQLEAFLIACSALDLPFKEQQEAVARFMSLPAARAMPESLKQELIERGYLQEIKT